MKTCVRRLLAGLAAVCLIASLGATVPAGATSEFSLDRLEGPDRYATAAEIALDAFPDGAEGALIATGEEFPDALAGAFMGGLFEVPLLLVAKDSVPEATHDALEALGVETIVILGGKTVVSESVRDELEENYDVATACCAGGDRFHTASMVAETAAPNQIGTIEGKSTAIIVSGFSFADALAAGPVAFSQQFPILLTGPEGLAQPSRESLEELEIEHVLVIGGRSVVGDRVVQEIEEMDITTKRIEGADRFFTAAAVADFALAELDFSATHVNLAKGIDPDPKKGFADALAGAAHSGRETDGPSPILLTDSSQLSAATQSWLEAHASTLVDGHIFGGPSAVSSAVEQAAEAAGRRTPGEVVRVDKSTDTYIYVPEGSDSAVTVKYSADPAKDRFFVTENGTTSEATYDAFELRIDPGDHIQLITGTPQQHRLVQVTDAEINGRTAGNVDLGANQFDFINDVTGDAVRSDISYTPTGAAYRFDGSTAAKTLDEFEKALNEGDVVTISSDGKTFTLRERPVSGSANSVTVTASSATVTANTTLKIDVYGDVADGSDDTHYKAEEGDAFAGDATTYTEFATQIDDGDLVTYTRVNGLETFTLDNRPAPTVSGTAKSIDKNGDADLFGGGNDTDGGKMTLVHADASEATYAYNASTDDEPADFFVDGVLGTEKNFEDAYTQGDKVEYTPADEGQRQVIKLTNVAPASSSS